jgi:protein LSM12
LTSHENLLRAIQAEQRTNFYTSIKLTCAPHNNTLEGTLFTTCNVTNAIAINTAPPPPNPSASLANQPGDYHIIPFAHIINFEIVGPGERAVESGPGFDGALPSISKVDLDALKAREDQTIREMKKKDAMKGKGVTKEAQDIFDYIARTSVFLKLFYSIALANDNSLPTRWHGTDIIVNDAVIICAPYGVEYAKAGPGKEQSLAHVKKIMENYNLRKKTSTGDTRAPVATPIAPRKGG